MRSTKRYSPSSGTCNSSGTCTDYTVITKVDGEKVYFVVNAGNREKDLAHIGAHLSEWQKGGKDVTMTTHEDRALLAVQGPEAAATLQKLVEIDELLTLFV